MSDKESTPVDRGGAPRFGVPEEVGALEAERTEGKKRKGLIWIILAIVLIIAGIVLGLSSCLGRNVEGGVPDMSGNIIVPEDPEHSDPSFLESADAVEGDQGNFRVPVVGLTAPLGSVNAVNGVLNPPGFTGAYVVRNMGVRLADAATGTVFVITHSVHGGGTAPGNYLIDVTEGTTSLHVGDLIHVGDRTYSFTESFVVVKEELGSHPEFFESVPGRLVIITCLQTPAQGKSYDNIVLFAQLVPEE